MKYPVIYNGEWFRPKRRQFLMACCDCGLVHAVSFRLTQGQLLMQMNRDNRRTAAVRRHKKRGE